MKWPWRTRKPPRPSPGAQAAVELAERLRRQALEQSERAGLAATESLRARRRNHFGEAFGDSVRRRRA